MNTTVMALSARALLGRRRVLFLLPMPLVLVGMVLIPVSFGEPTEVWGQLVFGNLGLAVLLPLTALIVGTSVLGLEIDDGTITHLLTKPLRRSEIITAKLVVSWLVTTVASAVPLVIGAVIAGSGTLAIGLAVGAAVGALAYCALFLGLSAATRRPVAIGLAYLVLWENILVTYVDGAKVFSIQQHATTIADDIAGNQILTATVGTATALAMAAAFAVAGTVLATQRLRSYALTGDTA